MMPEKIGFVGVGIMGAPMARNLLKAGHGLLVHTQSRAKEDLAKQDTTVSGTPAEVAEDPDVVTMLPGPPEVEVVFGEMLDVTSRSARSSTSPTGSSPRICRSRSLGRPRGLRARATLPATSPDREGDTSCPD